MVSPIVQALVFVTSFTQALNLLLNVATAAAALYLLLTRWRLGSPLSAQPLQRGQSRWIVGLDWKIRDSCTHVAEHGIPSGWAVGHSVTEWAPPGTEGHEAYRTAIEDRVETCYLNEYTSQAGLPRVGLVALTPASDGTVYCESRDVTTLVRRYTRAEAELARAQVRVAALIKTTLAESAALYEAPTQAQTDG